MRLVLLTAASVLLLAGCASSGKPAATGSSPAAALSLWKDFPATAAPRPLVLAGSTIIDPAGGFVSGDDKLAYVYGQFTVAGTLPTTSSSWHGRQLSTAAQALAELRGKALGTPPTSATLKVIAARLGTATFVTDRGQQALPAWQFSFAGVRDVASVLAIAAADRWPVKPRPATDTSDLAARIAPDGSTITLMFIGGTADPGPCQENYQAGTVQSDSAVLVTVRELPSAASSGSGSVACAAIGYQRSVTVKLEPALGGRVLIDSDGAPLPVRPGPEPR
jgi:hypothetical protein